MSAELPPAIATDGTLLDKLALDRQKLWETIGMPQSPKFMTEEIMNRDFRGRFCCINRDVLKEAQHALKFVACPRCVIEKPYGEIAVTRFHILVQDDVMTVFAAMARCFCYNCAHEEFWPLSRDPRTINQQKMDEERYQYEREMKMRQLQAQRNAASQSYPPMARGIGGGALGASSPGLLGGAGGVAGGSAMGMGQNAASNPFNSMHPDEMEALQRIYADTIKDHSPSQQKGLMDAIRKRMGM